MRNVTPCPNWRELLSAYQDRALSPKDTKRVAAHLETCADCRKALAQMEGDRDRFIEAYMAPAANADLREPVLTALRPDASAPAQQPQRKFSWDWAFRISSAVAAITLILFVAVIMGREPESTGKQQTVHNPPIFSATTDDTGDTSSLNTVDQLHQNNVDNSFSTNKSADVSGSFAATDIACARVLTENDYGMNAYLYGVDKSGDILGSPLGQLETPSENRLYAANDDTGKRSITVPTYTQNGAKDSYAMSGLLNRPDSTLKIAYDVNYRLQVKHALQKSRQAQGIINKLGGFTMNYQYVNNEHEPAVAAFDGKIPAEKAEEALAEIEKLGNVRGLNIAGEDLTGQFQQQQAEIARQQEHAEKLNKLSNRSTAKVAVGVEEQRNDAKGQVTAAKQALIGLTTRHKLVTVSAAFYESQPREPMTLARATAGTRRVLNYALLLVVTIAVFFLVAALVASPFVALRYWRRRRMAA